MREPVDEVEVADDLRRTQDRRVVEPGRAERPEPRLDVTRRVARQRLRIRGERAVGRGERCRRPLDAQCLGDGIVANGAAETRRVVLDSIVAAVDGARYHAEQLALRAR